MSERTDVNLICFDKKIEEILHSSRRQSDSTPFFDDVNFWNVIQIMLSFTVFNVPGGKMPKQCVGILQVVSYKQHFL